MKLLKVDIQFKQNEFDVSIDCEATRIIQRLSDWR